MQGKYQLHITNPFCSTKSCRFQAANEMNVGMYVCLTKSCPADALEDWDIQGAGIDSHSSCSKLKLKLALHNYTVAKSKFYFWVIRTTNASQMEDFFEFCVTK